MSESRDEFDDDAEAGTKAPTPAPTEAGGDTAEEQEEGEGTKGGGKGRGNRGQAEDKKKVRVKGGKRGQADADKQQCFSFGCEEPKAGKAKWCEEHRRVAQALEWRAARDGSKVALDEDLADPKRANQRFENHVADNPEGKKWFRAPPTSWAKYEQRTGTESRAGNIDDALPMTSHQFQTWATEKMAVGQQGAKRWWNELYTNRHILQTDWKGRHEDGRTGCFRIYIPDSDSRSRSERMKFKAAEVVESSASKKMSAEDVRALKAHTKNASRRDDDHLLDPDTGGDEARPSTYGTPSKKPRVEDASPDSPASASAVGQVQGEADPDALEAIEDINAPLLAHVACTGELKELSKEMTQAKNDVTATQTFVRNKDFDKEEFAFKGLEGSFTFRGDAVRLWLGLGEELCGEGEDTQSLTLEQHLLTRPNFMPVANPSMCIAKQNMENKLKEVGAVRTASDLGTAKQAWGQHVLAGRQLAASTKKGALDLKNHVAYLAREKAKEARTTNRERVLAEQRAGKAKADGAAAAVRNPPVRAALDEVFKISTDCFETPQKIVLDADGKPQSLAVSWDQPWVYEGESAAVESLLQREVLKTNLAEFAKHFTKADGFEEDHRATAELEAGKGKEETDALLLNACPDVLKLNSVAGGVKFNNDTYLVGYHNKMQWCGVSPNWAGVLRLHVAGSLTCYAFEIHSFLLSIAKANGKESIEDVPTFDETKDLIAGLTAERLEELHKHDLICVALDINPKSVSYIPCGWILAEKAKEGDGTDLIYGIRKSVFKSSQANKTSYQLAQRIFDKSGKLFSKK